MKKIVSKGWYTIIELIPIPILLLAFFGSLSDSLFIFFIFLGFASFFLRFFYTSKENIKEKNKESKYIKTTEYYVLIIVGFLLSIIALITITAYFGDEWSSNLLPFEIKDAFYAFIPAIGAGWCFLNTSKFKKKISASKFKKKK